MTAGLLMGGAMGMSRMNMGLMLGSMVSGDRSTAQVVGWAAHAMMGLVFGLVYALLWWVLDPGQLSDAWWMGLIFGAVHGVVAMVMMPVMDAMHPRSGDGPAPAGSEEVRLPRFGLGGTGFGSMTPVGIELGHLVFGVVWGLVFWALL